MAKSFPNTGTTVIDAVGDLPASPSEGMMVFQKDTNELKIYDGSSWISMLDTDTPPGIQLLTSNSFSSASSVNIDTIFSASFINYKLFINITSASGGGSLNFYMRSGTTNIITDYQWNIQTQEGSSSPTANTGTGTSGILGYCGYSGGGQWGTTQADIFSPFEAAWTKTLSTSTGVTAGGAGATLSGGTWHKLSTSYNGILFFVPSVTITGTYRLYGYR
jgi:hypothetical protein